MFVIRWMNEIFPWAEFNSWWMKENLFSKIQWNAYRMASSDVVPMPPPPLKSLLTGVSTLSNWEHPWCPVIAGVYAANAVGTCDGAYLPSPSQIFTFLLVLQNWIRILTTKYSRLDLRGFLMNIILHHLLSKKKQ